MTKLTVNLTQLGQRTYTMSNFKVNNVDVHHHITGFILNGLYCDDRELLSRSRSNILKNKQQAICQTEFLFLTAPKVTIQGQMSRKRKNKNLPYL